MVTKPAKPASAHFPYDGDEVDDLTIEYPSSDGEPVAESDYQYTPMSYAVSSLRVRYHGREDVYIAGDMLVYYRMNQRNVRVAPDVYAVFGVTGNHRRDTWLVWREGKAPDFVMEIASPGTWRRDVGEKRDIYARMRVQEYVRLDPTGQCFTPALVIESLDGGIYRPRPVTMDADGILRGYSAVLELEICVLPGLELRFYDPATGEWLRSHQESETALRAAEAAKQAAEVGLQQSEAARQRFEAAKQRSEAARQAAEAELRQSEAARQEAQAEAARLRAILEGRQQQEPDEQ